MGEETLVRAAGVNYGLETHKELSCKVHVRPSLRVGGRRRPPFPQRTVLHHECLESHIEVVEASGSVRHEARLSPAAAPELFNFARRVGLYNGDESGSHKKQQFQRPSRLFKEDALEDPRSST